MEFVVIAIVSAGASLLTLFSGFGLGTILMPAFAVFFPLDIAISLAAWLGVYVGGKFLKKATFSFMQRLVSGMVVVIAFLLGSGLI